MFQSEADMLPPVTRWMESIGLTIKSEFVTPWGICDLVGVSFKKRNVEKRVRFGQRKAVGSITRAALLHHIPEHFTTNLKTLATTCCPTICPKRLADETDRLIRDKFVTRDSEGNLRRVDGWVPLHNRLVAVELKLQRIENVMLQASHNLSFAGESYIAVPSQVAQRIKAKRSKWVPVLESGVGVISVSENSCRVIIRSHNRTQPDPVLQFYCIEKFWRAHITSSSS